MAMQNKNVVSKVVGPYEVESYTLQGWRVAEVLQEECVESFSESVPFVPQGQSYVTNGSGTRGFLVRKNLFLMIKDGSSLIAEANDRVAAAEARGHDLASKLIESDKKTADEQKLVTKLKLELDSTAAFSRQLSAQLVTERDLKQKMENDIAKIRQAVGELKMKEILGA